MPAEKRIEAQSTDSPEATEALDISRRSFLANSAAAVAVAPLASFPGPYIIGQDKTAAQTVVIGEGTFKYECLHDWGELPPQHQYGGATHGVTIDADGLIYLTHQGGPGSVVVFDPEGKFVRTLGKQFAGSGHGIDLRNESGEEFLYLSPANMKDGFCKMTLNGEVVWQKNLETLQSETGAYQTNQQRMRATNVSFSPDGGYFLGDGYGSCMIHQYDKSDNFVRTIGGAGTADGKFKTPHGQWLDDRDGIPKLVVADRANQRLQWFDMDGTFLKKLDGFLFPADIDIQGELMLVPDLHCRITILDKDNAVVAQLGDDEAWREKCLLKGKTAVRNMPQSWLPGKFVHPHDACFDREGNIFVAEWVKTGRFTKLKRVT